MSVNWQAYGRFEYDVDPAPIIKGWLAAQSCANAYERRDLEDWIEAALCVDGRVIEIYEDTSTPFEMLEQFKTLVEALAGSAREGEAFVQTFFDGEVEAEMWRVRGGKTNRSVKQGTGDAPPCALPRGTRAEAHGAAVWERQCASERGRSTAERIQEMISRVGPGRCCVLIVGSDAAERRKVVDALHRESRSSQLVVLGASELTSEIILELSPSATLFVDSIEEVDLGLQEELLDKWRGGLRLIGGTGLGPEQVRAQVGRRLNLALYYRLCAAEIEL